MPDVECVSGALSFFSRLVGSTERWPPSRGERWMGGEREGGREGEAGDADGAAGALAY